ncbi:MAG TPA: CAP domain-containing protein [Dehalococcoidia bacterium]|nr:CAP domain-containing protein [Dehalococcoidia bacterium]
MKTRPFLIAAVATAAVIIAVAYASGPADETSANTTLDTEEQAFVTLINDYRAQNGRGPLLIDNSIQGAAHWMSASMGQYNFFSHTDHLGQSPWTRMCNFGYCYDTYKGENIAAGFTTASSVFDAWKNSSGHNSNMLNANYKVMGVAREYTAGSTYGWYWTNDFGGYVATAPADATPTPSPAPPPAPTNTPAPTATPAATATPAPTDPGCPGDSDCDGYSDALEALIGTIPNKRCAATLTALDENPQAWPPDFDDNRRVNTTDVLAFKAVFNSYSARFDLDGDGDVDTSDILHLKAVFGKTCTP